jgi:geranylgeranyl diphosphate synthase type II
MYEDITISVKRQRPPQDNVPKTKQQRDRLLQIVAEYIEREKAVGPLTLAELQKHSQAILKTVNLDAKYIDFVAIMVSNEVWRPVIAGIPCERRLLLLPKCLRSQKCAASFDEVGLLCEHCGRCIIDELASRAEQLGYAVLIAEGSPVVMSLIEAGKIEAIVGVSCLSVLERVFPYIEAGAIPGIAIPLLQDGCADTSVDIDWVWDAIYLNSEQQCRRLDIEDMRSQVNSWFTSESLNSFFGTTNTQTEKLALEWLAKAGKRWRPFLAACTYKALAEDSERALSEDVRKVAIAVECFHKASLIHDDIEDADMKRYGQSSLHVEYGIPIALNVGDFLLGEGYRLLTELKIPSNRKADMLAVAAQGHRDLCLGQGNELSWIGKPRPLSVAEVIEIFSKKTSPAFEVALKLGAISAGCGAELGAVLKQYSESLGIAYQIRDDIDDFHSENKLDALKSMRPSLLLAMAYELSERGEKRLLEAVWCRSVEPASVVKDIENILETLKIEQLAWNLMESQKSRAINALSLLNNSNLKSLLRRVIGKIFYDFEVMGCCNDNKAGYAEGSRPGEESSG